MIFAPLTITTTTIIIIIVTEAVKGVGIYSERGRGYGNGMFNSDNVKDDLLQRQQI
jgi:hypothetical protein